MLSEFPEYKLHLVPFEDDHEGILSEIGKLGEKFDFLIGVCDSRTWLSMCQFLPLGRYRKMGGSFQGSSAGCKATAGDQRSLRRNTDDGAAG